VSLSPLLSLIRSVYSTFVGFMSNRMDTSFNASNGNFITTLSTFSISENESYHFFFVISPACYTLLVLNIAFAPTPSFTRSQLKCVDTSNFNCVSATSVHSEFCACPSCMQITHSRGCGCGACSVSELHYHAFHKNLSLLSSVKKQF